MRSPADELFGHHRLPQLVNGTFPSASALIQNIQQQLAAFIGQASQEDDITLLAVHRKSRPAGN